MSNLQSNSKSDGGGGGGSQYRAAAATSPSRSFSRSLGGADGGPVASAAAAAVLDAMSEMVSRGGGGVQGSFSASRRGSLAEPTRPSAGRTVRRTSSLSMGDFLKRGGPPSPMAPLLARHHTRLGLMLGQASTEIHDTNLLPAPPLRPGDNEQHLISPEASSQAIASSSAAGSTASSGEAEEAAEAATIDGSSIGDLLRNRAAAAGSYRLPAAAAAAAIAGRQLRGLSAPSAAPFNTTPEDVSVHLPLLRVAACARSPEGQGAASPQAPGGVVVDGQIQHLIGIMVPSEGEEEEEEEGASGIAMQQQQPAVRDTEGNEEDAESDEVAAIAWHEVTAKPFLDPVTGRCVASRLLSESARLLPLHMQKCSAQCIRQPANPTACACMGL